MRTESDWMLTFTGKAYWPRDPQPEEVCIEDLAHGLSMLCRYSGQIRSFYSVAEHSVLVSMMVPPELALEALLHDASEAYCSDISTPLKRGLPDYRKIEALNALAIRLKFGLPLAEHPLVKQADTDILLTEQDLLAPVPAGRIWQVNGVRRENIRVCCWTPKVAERAFLERFEEVTKDWS